MKSNNKSYKDLIRYEGNNKRTKNMNFNTFTSNWKTELANKNFRNLFIITIITIAVTLTLFTNFLTMNETRSGFAFDDPILSLFAPINLTWSTFAMIYGGLLTGLFIFIQKPKLLVQALLTYTILVLFRMMLMYSLPLDPPHDMISLVDPFVELFGTGATLDKDLFFSGHTSTMFMLFLLSYKPKMKWIFLIGTILVGLSVILQHAHYTVDVLAAPFVAYAAYRIALHIKNYSFNTDD